MKTQPIQYIRSLAFITVSSVALLAGCQNTEYPDPQPSTTGFLTTAKALIVNASNAAGITALIENVAAGSSLAPGANTGYVAAPVSSDQVRIQGAGGTLTTDLSAKSTFAANTNYTVFVTDTISRPKVTNASTGAVTDAGGVRLLTVTDNLTAPAAGSANVRFFQLAPDASAVSVRLVPTAPTSVTLTPTLLNRAYRVTTVTSGTVTTNYANFTAVPAATYTAQVFSGATIPTSATVSPVLSVSGVTLADGKIYTIYTRGLRRDKTLNLGTIQHN